MILNPGRLRSREGMRRSFQSIQVERSDSGWLPVRRFFEPVVKYLDSNNNEAKVRAVRDVMKKIFEGMPASTSETIIDPAPDRLRKQPTSTSMDNQVIL